MSRTPASSVMRSRPRGEKEEGAWMDGGMDERGGQRPETCGNQKKWTDVFRR